MMVIFNTTAMKDDGSGDDEIIDDYHANDTDGRW